MLAKLTSKNQLTLPKAITERVGPAEYFDVDVRDGQIILTPVRIQRADAIRAKLSLLGVTEADVADAVEWVRKERVSLVANEPAPKRAASLANPRTVTGKKRVRRA